LLETAIDNVRINFDTQTLWILNLSLALVMFGIALEISVADFKNLVRKPKPILVGVASQFLLLPFVTFLLVSILEPLPSFAMGMFMVAACPGGNVSNFISHLAKANTALSVSLTAMATLLAVLMTPLNLQFWGAMYAPTASILQEVAVAPLEMIKLVAFLLAIPLILGMWMKHRKPLWAKKLAKILKLGSLLFFIALVFLALYANRTVFADYIFYVFWIVTLHNLLAITTGYSFAKILGLSPRDSRTVAIETGIQNSGLGLLLIFTFFDGLGGMAILAAFWGVWHLVSGILLAAYWGFKPIKKKELV
jgi:BASS family bile acid:Na+ symporter